MAEKEKGGRAFPSAHLIKVLVERESEKRNKTTTKSCCSFKEEESEHLCGVDWHQMTEARSPKDGQSPPGGCVLFRVFFFSRCFPCGQRTGHLLWGQGRLWFGRVC